MIPKVEDILGRNPNDEAPRIKKEIHTLPNGQVISYKTQGELREKLAEGNTPEAQG